MIVNNFKLVLFDIINSYLEKEDHIKVVDLIDEKYITREFLTDEEFVIQEDICDNDFGCTFGPDIWIDGCREEIWHESIKLDKVSISIKYLYETNEILTCTFYLL